MKVIALAISILGFSVLASCQTTTHSADLTWTASPTVGVTYNVYRGNALCANSPTFAKVGNAATLSFHDANLPAKTAVSYVVKATDGTLESIASNCVDGTTTVDAPLPPGSLVVVIK